MNWIKLLVFLFGVIILGCKEETSRSEQIEDGVVILKDFIWRTDKTDARFARATIMVPHIIDGLFINSFDFDGEVKLAAYSAIDGARAWVWDDFIEPPSTLGFDVFWSYVYEGRLMFRQGNEGYGIDAVNGETLWKKVDEYGNTDSYINGFKDYILKTAYPINYDGESYGLDVIDNIYGSHEKIIPPQPIPPLDSSAIDVVTASNGSTRFDNYGQEYLINISVQADEKWNAYPYLGLYNLTEERWEYYGKQLLPAGPSRVADGFPIIEDGIVVNSVGHFICANDLWTGDSLWAVDCENNFVFGGFFIHEGCVYAMAEARALYCFDLETGQECWRMDDDGLGTTSQMVHHNGVIYFTSGGNGRLMAVDMDNGDLLWNIKSPDSESFNREIALWLGDNSHDARVLTATYESVLAYNVVR